VRFACVSDVHVSDTVPDEDGNDILAQEWLAEWLEALEAEGDIDHVLMCGDLIGSDHDPIDSGDFALLRAVLRTHGRYDGRRTTVLPGNHDVRRRGFLPAGDGVRSLYRHFPNLFAGPVLASPYYFPIAKHFPGVHVVALDTASDWDVLHSGALGDEQLKELERLLARPAIRSGHVILAMHHAPLFPADGMNRLAGWLWDAGSFWDIVDASNVDLVVCGHDHESWEREKNGVPIVCVGGFMEDDSEALIVDAGEGSLKYFWWNAWE
jgi:3',5'-cyclic AMP phosphodiesterase CpdA